MTARIWLSFDLGVRGDYSSLYAWLDDNEAEECGSSVATFRFEYDGDLLESLKSEIENAISLSKQSRIYVVYKENGKSKGKYVFGRRKRSPWDGYGTLDDGSDDDDE